MGDISRHRDIYLNTRAAIPADLLARCRLSAGDLTYLELGNYLTDVSQFRDPVFYIFAKQRVWREFVLPKVADKVLAARVLAGLAGYAGALAAQGVKELTSGRAAQVADISSYTLAGLGGAAALLPSFVSTDTIAGLRGADDWIDQMLGTPVERLPGDPRKRDQKHYGYVGQFFRHFVEGITHLLFAADVSSPVKGGWGQIGRIPHERVTAIYEAFFTQYYPHEHTDQPPYVWDANKRARPQNATWYGPSRRQRTLKDPDIGIMNVVDEHYVQYLAEGLGALEQAWRTIGPADADGRQRWLVRLGKLLHGVEDWYFHSNVVELARLRGHKPARAEGESDEQFLQRFVVEALAREPEYLALTEAGQRAELKRRLYRRLRFPAYEPADRVHSGGRLSPRTSTTSLHVAYPAFPSQQDSTNTLLHALENLETKAFTSSGATTLADLLQRLPALGCVFLKLLGARGGPADRLLDEKARARGTTRDKVLALRSLPPGPERDRAEAAMTDVLREWLPLVATLLVESERQRLVAGIAPEDWPVGTPTPALVQGGPGGDAELDKQWDRHKAALKRERDARGVEENNYERAARYLYECGFLNAAGRDALLQAFDLDRQSQALRDDAPGSGAFLISFAVDLQRALDEGEARVAELNARGVVFEQATDDGAFNENIGSHSLMSKDTLSSRPFFEDARVLASVASATVFHVMLEQVSAPTPGRHLPWTLLLHQLIRYPPAAGGWERHALTLFRTNRGQIPRYADLPELGQLVQTARRAPAAQTPYRPGTKDEELKEAYIKLEREVSNYRYP